MREFYKQQITDQFTYHPPKPEDMAKFTAIREAALKFALVIAENTKECSEQYTAINKTREAVMWANAAIALEGKAETLLGAYSRGEL
jgi:hypothetical protein